MIFNRVVLTAVLTALFCYSLATYAQNDTSEDIDSKRIELVERWGMGSLPNPHQVASQAKYLFALPLEEQSEEELKTIADQANRAANFVGFILDEYSEFYRDNYRYESIQNSVAPFHDAYVHLSNRLKGYRNQAYFNLGKKAAKRGHDVDAFFLFRDAYRLSSFVDYQGDHKGIRYLAEIEMKNLLGINEIDTFLFWR